MSFCCLLTLDANLVTVCCQRNSYFLKQPKEIGLIVHTTDDLNSLSIYFVTQKKIKLKIIKNK